MTFQKWTVARSAVPLIVAIGLTALTSEASAQDGAKERQQFEDTIHVIQKKPVLESGRFELAPRFGMSVNDSIYQSFKVGINANYHITERIHVGGMFEWFDFNEALGGPTQSFQRSFGQTSTVADAPVPEWFAAGEFGYKPIYGKFALFNSVILYYDIGVSLGAGWFRSNAISSSQSESSGSFAGTAALRSRLFINDFMAVSLNLRDVVYQASLQGGAVQPLANLVTVSAGVSFYIPPSFEYSDTGESGGTDNGDTSNGSSGGGGGGGSSNGNGNGGSDNGGGDGGGS